MPRRRNKARAQRARPQTACERNASPPNSFQAQRVAFKQLLRPSSRPQTATPRFQTASKHNVSPSNSFRAPRLARKQLSSPTPRKQLPARRLTCKQLPSATSRPQTASKPLDSPLKQLRSAARPFAKNFRVPQIRSLTASSKALKGRILTLSRNQACSYHRVGS